MPASERARLHAEGRPEVEGGRERERERVVRGRGR